jgi:hypothetical protein
MLSQSFLSIGLMVAIGEKARASLANILPLPLDLKAKGKE